MKKKGTSRMKFYFYTIIHDFENLDKLLYFLLILAFVLDFKRNDECIDLTLMCVFFKFFYYLYTQLVVELIFRFSTSVPYSMGK